MQKRTVGKSNLEVSVVGLGTWAMGNDFFGEVDDSHSIGAIQSAIDSGINLIDTAPAYGAGHSEEVVGKAIKGRRDEVILGTKVGIIRTATDFVRNLKPESIRKEIDDSLRRLGVDTIDLYQIHWPDPDTPLEESLEELIKLREQGKYRYLGVSNFDTKLMSQAEEQAGIVSLQPQFSLLVRDIEDEILPFCRKHNFGVLSYGTLAGGILTGKFREIPQLPKGDNRDKFYQFFKEPEWTAIQGLLTEIRAIGEELGVTPAQVSTRWAIQQPGITSALVGAKNADQAAANAKAGEFELEKAHLDRIQEAYERTVGTLG
ncbi:MAG: aldo/keto reductase [Alkalispirochaetaceae bacterium]